LHDRTTKIVLVESAGVVMDDEYIICRITRARETSVLELAETVC
jgi:hypothetical protein